MRLILASGSPRRAELLRTGGFVFEVVTSDVDERVLDGESPRAYVRRLASEKSAAVYRRALERGPGEREGAPGLSSGAHASLGTPGVAVLAADTAVVVDEDIFGKPADAAEWRRMLHRLSGRRHEVLTGLSLRWGGQETTSVESTAVFFSPLEPSEIDEYMETGEGMDKAGGYAVQGLASRFIHRIEGSYSNVVGLPVSTVYQWLRGQSYR